MHALPFYNHGIILYTSIFNFSSSSTVFLRLIYFNTWYWGSLILNNLCYPTIWKYHIILFYSPAPFRLFLLSGVHTNKILPYNTPHGVVPVRCSSIMNHESTFLLWSCCCDLWLDRGNHMLTVNVRCLKRKDRVWRNPSYIEDEYWFPLSPEHQNTLLWTWMLFLRCLSLAL